VKVIDGVEHLDPAGPGGSLSSPSSRHGVLGDLGLDHRHHGDARSLMLRMLSRAIIHHGDRALMAIG